MKPLPHFLLLLFAMLSLTKSYGQSSVFELTISDSAAIHHIDTINGLYVPTFANATINSTFNGSGVAISIQQAMPFADQLCLRNLWYVTGADSALMDILIRRYPVLFPAYRLMLQYIPFGHIPNDWTVSPQTPNGIDYLHFIGAERAWQDTLGLSQFGTKGDSTVLIGVVDDYFNLVNPDIGDNTAAWSIGSPTFDGLHGTHVAGLAAGRTNNHLLLPSIGYRCKLNLSNSPDIPGRPFVDGELLRIARDTTGGRVRVVNGSYGFSYGSPTLDIDGATAALFDEIYDNGVTTVFSAGNGEPGHGGPAPYYCFPASNDHIISVTTVGHLAPTGPPGSPHIQDVHEFKNAGDSTQTHNHNDRVDICAPGCAVWMLSCDTNNLNAQPLDLTTGTSFAAPLVAGTCGLMYSQQSCLTPYQVEYLLKKTSRDIYDPLLSANHAYNVKYAGSTRWNSRLGAGRLTADTAVWAAHPQLFSCDDSATRTMTIDGVRLTHNCYPGTVRGLDTPRLIIGSIHNGLPLYRYLWSPIPGNTVALSSYTAASPQIIGIDPNSFSNIPVAAFRLAVYDASDVQKVASFTFQVPMLTDTVSDLAMRDSYYDMLDEPNTQCDVNRTHYDIWHNPDFWVRDSNDFQTEPQNPERFGNSDTNTIYVRIRNVGCKANAPDVSDLHVYWTWSSTGENWSNDWLGVSKVRDTFGYLTIPGGGEITTPTAVRIPIIQPGDSELLRVTWHIQRPEIQYKRPKQLDACILARIIEPNLPLNGLHTAETTRTASNVNNNNNIVTRNLSIVSLHKACATCHSTSNPESSTHRVYIANGEDHDQVYTVDMLTEKDTKRFLSGDISKYVYVTLDLGDLYDRWQQCGGKGHYMRKDDESKTVTYDPSSPLRLEGVNLHASEHFPVDITFTLRSNVDVPFAIKGNNVYIRQLIKEGKGDKVYGAVVYSLNIAASGSPQQQQRSNSQSESNNPASKASFPYYAIYPNPVSGNLSIKYTGTIKATTSLYVTDVSGRVITRKDGIAIQPGAVYQIKMSQYAAGTYFIHIEDSNGTTGIQKISKE